MPEPQSEQEERLHTQARWSFGGPFLFLPDIWRSGRSNNQPADMVWVANDCVVLMFMCSVETRGDAVKDRAKFDKAKRHNSMQAKGSLRRWRNGKHITGTAKNTIEDVKHVIKADSIAHVIVLSIVQSGGTIAQVDDTLAKELGITMFATIPEYSLMGLTSVGGGLVDLVIVLGELATKGEMTEDEFNQHALDYIATCREIADFNSTWKEVDVSARRALVELISHCRYQSVDEHSHPLVDMSLSDTFKIMRCFHDLEKKNDIAKARGTTAYADITLPLKSYVCDIFMGDLTNSESHVSENFGSFIRRTEGYRNTPYADTAFWFFRCARFGATTTHSYGVKRPSFLRQLLDSPREDWLNLFALGSDSDQAAVQQLYKGVLAECFTCIFGVGFWLVWPAQDSAAGRFGVVLTIFVDEFGRHLEY